MNYQRKRVAKRLASGLLAGALALGGLAISGGSVSAKTPVTALKRVQGTDRYATAIALANKYIDNAAPVSNWATSANIVVASGESASDALSASALAALVKAPIILTKSNELPASVRDWLLTRQGTFSAASGGKVYVVGGTSAVADSVVTSILSTINVVGDTTPHTSVRLAGADRYATAAAVNGVSGVLNGGDAVVIVDGRNWADAVSIAPFAFKNGWPIIPINGALDASSTATLTAYLTLAGVTGGRSNGKAVIIGGPAAVPKAVEEALVTAGFEYSKIQRIFGADRYQTSLLINASSVSPAGIQGQNLTGQEVALSTGENFADALAAAPFLGLNGYHLQLTNSSSLNASAKALLEVLASTDALKTPTTLWTIGGTSAVADSVVTAAVSAAQVTNIAPQAMICQEGSALVVLAIPESYTGYTLDTIGAAPSAAEQTAILAAFAKDGVALTGAAAPLAAVFGDLDGNLLIDSIIVQFPGNLTTPVGGSSTYSFLGMTEAAGTNKRSIAASSCSLTDDLVPPVITSISATQKTGGTNKSFVIEASEEVVCSNASADETKLSVNNVAAAAAVADITIAKLTATKCKITFAAGAAAAPYSAALTAGHAIAISAGFIFDVAGNANAAPASGVVTVDNGNPTATGAVLCLPNASANAQTNANGLDITAVDVLDGGSKDGVAGSGYKVSIVGKRGLLIPTVVIDDTAKTIVITADVTYHLPGDVVAAVNNLGGDANWDFAVAGTGTVLAATAIPITVTAGTQVCTITLTGSELLSAGTNVSLTVNGITVAPGAAAGTLNTAQTKLTWSMAPTTPVLSGSVAFVGTLTDLAGNQNAAFSLAI